MTDQDRNVISALAAIAEEDKIIITHGTDTIHVTAAELNIVKDKTIVLTRAMKPEKFADTDAHFNVGMAVGAILSLSPGVYIALYGEVVAWENFVPR